MRRQLALVILVAAPARAQVVVSPHLDAKIAGDVETQRGGVGVSAGYFLRGLRGIGFELDVAWHGHFFRDEDVAHLVPDRVDLNTDALLVSGNVVVPFAIPGAPIWRPYATAGLGVSHAIFDAVNNDAYDRDQNDLSVNAGLGIMHQLTRWVGLRVEARYTHTFVDADASAGGYLTDYAFWRVSVGATFNFPAYP